MAVSWVTRFQKAPWLMFVLAIAFFVLCMTNFIINVAAIAISLPVSLVIAGYLGVAPHVIFFASLATAGMPFNLLIGAAPNAIAYESKQFSAGEFFTYGWIPSRCSWPFWRCSATSSGPSWGCRCCRRNNFLRTGNRVPWCPVSLR